MIKPVCNERLYSVNITMLWVEKNLDFTIEITKKKNGIKIIKMKTKGTTIDDDML